MKNILLSIALLFILHLASAQTEEGGITVGVTSDLSLTTTSRDGQDDNVGSFNVGGQVGYFIVDHLAVGGSLGLSRFAQGDFSSTGFSIGPAARYYFNGTFFLGGAYAYGVSRSDNNGEKSTFKSSLIRFEGGYPIWIVENVAVEPSLVYSLSRSKDFSDSDTFGLFIGFNLYF